MKYLLSFLPLLLFALPKISQAQPLSVDDIVEVTGIVITPGPNGKVAPIPFATVAVENGLRGTYANMDGMFSIVVKKGETMQFSAVGFATQEITIPEDFEGLYRSIVVQLETEDINMTEVLVFPWPDRNNFRAEFLAMQPTQAQNLQALAEGKLSRQQLLAMQEEMDLDGRENASLYLRQQASSYSYQGQQQAMPVLNPLAWAQFFKQFKKKDK